MPTETTQLPRSAGALKLTVRVCSITLLLLLPSYAGANPVIAGGCDESLAWYDIAEALHSSHPSCGFDVDGNGGFIDPFPDHDIAWTAFSDSLLQLTNTFDSSGHVVKSHYSYVGGILDLSLTLSGLEGGQFLVSYLHLPIMLMDVFVTENTIDDDGVEVLATFGPGLLDAAFANALGIGRHITGGTLSDPHLFGANTDYTDMQRHAGEGAPTIILDVPEPSVMTLCFAGIVALGAQSRRRRRPPLRLPRTVC